MKAVGGPFDGLDIPSNADTVVVDGIEGRYMRWRELHEVERYYLWQSPLEYRDPPHVQAIKDALREASK